MKRKITALTAECILSLALSFLHGSVVSVSPEASHSLLLSLLTL
jgi:hypothetical protein